MYVYIAVCKDACETVENSIGFSGGSGLRREGESWCICFD